MADVIFVEGVKTFKPSENSPEWIKANFKVNKTELLNWLATQPDEFRMILKQSSKGGFYLAKDTYEGKNTQTASGNEAKTMNW